MLNGHLVDNSTVKRLASCLCFTQTVAILSSSNTSTIKYIKDLDNNILQSLLHTICRNPIQSLALAQDFRRDQGP